MPLPPNPSLLDANQCIQGSYDDAEGRLRVDAVVTATIADVIIHDSESSIAIGDQISGNLMTVEGDGSINANVVLNHNTDSVTAYQGTSPWIVSGTVTANAGTGTFLVDGSAHVQPISATSLPLPTGAATEATLSAFKTANHTDLTAINTTLGSPMQNSGGSVTVLQGTSPWVISGTVTTSPDVNIHDSVGNSLTSTTGSLNSNITNNVTVIQPTGSNLHVDVDNFPSTFGVTQSTSPWVVSGTVAATQSGTWTTGRTWALSSGTDSITVTGSVTTSPDINVHDGSGNPISSTTGSLNVDVTNTVPVSQLGTWNIGTVTTVTSITNPVAVTQSTSPWVISGTVTANAGTGTFTVSDAMTHTELTTINTTLGSPFQAGGSIGNTSFIATQTTGSNLHVNVDNFPATVAVTQSTSPWVVSGTVAATQSGTWTVQQGTPPWSVSQSGIWNIGTVTTLTSITNPVAVTQSTSPWVVSGTVTANQGTSPWVTSRNWTLSSGTDSVASVQSGSWSVTANIGTTGGLALDATLAKLTLAQGSTTASETGPLIQGAVTTAAPSYTTGQTSPLSLTTAGALRVDGSAVTQPISGTVAATQSGSWTTGRTWTLSSGTDSISAVQSGTWNIGTVTTITNPVTVTGTVAVTQSTSPWVTSRNWTLSNSTDSVAAVQSGTWTVQQGSAPWSVSQSGTWTTGRTWALASGTDSVSVVQSTSPWVTKDQADGTTGSTAPTTVITTGGKDTAGNLQPILIDENGFQSVSSAPETFTTQSKSFMASTNNVLVGTAETAFVLFRNPTGSGKTVKIFSIGLSGAGTFRIYHLPTITANGTAITAQNRKVVSGSQGNVGLMTFSPTISANGSLESLYVISGQEGTFTTNYQDYLDLPANTAILITAQMGANNTATNAVIQWAEL